MHVSQSILNDSILAQVPRVLSLLDKNPYSRSYGSFDRKYWHYKIIDFPCGMQQELVLPLAYVWKTESKNNPYCRHPRIKEYLDGVFCYHAKCSHADGSLDDYFPYERAFGATAYALTALTEAALLTGFRDTSVIESFKKSGEFLLRYREAGKLSNHLAIASTALMNLSLLAGDDSWRKYSDDLILELSSMQHHEGWFHEYEGCDLGYQTVTIEFLARRYQKAPSELLLGMLKRNVTFLRNFTHPDGSFGGEYCSRNTYNFYPGGFAILSSSIPEASEMLAFYFKGRATGTCNYLEDDGIFGHMLSSYVTVVTADDITIPEQIAERCTGGGLRYFEGAGLFVGRSANLSIFGATTKGGVFKIFKGDTLALSDTGYVGELSNGIRFCQNKARCARGKVQENTIVIEGHLNKYTSKRLSSIQMIGLRVLSLLFGKMKNYSNAIRFLMQKVLIYNRNKIDIGFTRTITLHDRGIKIGDTLRFPDTVTIRSLHRSTDCVNMHVITSDSFQAVNLCPWERMPIDENKIYNFERNITA